MGVALPVNLFPPVDSATDGCGIHLTLGCHACRKTRILAEEVAILKALQEQPEGAAGAKKRNQQES